MTIPGFTSTSSKRPDLLFGKGGTHPRRVVKANGCRVWDEENKEYVDLVMALGAVGLGYGHPIVNEAAKRAVDAGVVGPLPPRLETDVAERLAAVIPGGESVRFLKTGAEGVAAAVRIARVHTGRERVLTCGYHGWLDWCQNVAGVPGSVTDLRREVPFNDEAALEHAAGEFAPLAAIVVEPVIDGAPDPEWLRCTRQTADKAGAVLIFDEIKTAFRIAKGGAAEQYGIVPDLTVVGKALGNGFPIAAVVGPSGLMEAASATWISSTLATESVALAAAGAVLELYEREPVIEHLAHAGDSLFRGLEQLVVDYPKLFHSVRGIPQMCYLECVDDDVSAAMATKAAALGVILKRTAYNFVSYAHTDQALTTILERLDTVAGQLAHEC